MFALAQTSLGIAALTVVTVAALQDVRERLIANRLVLMLLGLGVLRHVVVAPSFADWLASAGGASAIAAGIFAVGFVVWRLGGLGGGDVKLLVAAGFFVGVDGILVLFAGTALAGGALAVCYLLRPVLAPMLAMLSTPHDRASAGSQLSLPYGVAIGAGLACVIVPSLPILIG